MNPTPEEKELNVTMVDHIPVAWIEPSRGSDLKKLIIWLPGLTGTKEQMKDFLEILANEGFIAVSFDPWQHGERSFETPEELGARVFDNFRRYMWPILGQTSLDTLRVLDWACQEFNSLNSFYMGGFSMGGDISVAVAGMDPRIQCVLAVVATPDWKRPGMHKFDDPDMLLPQGEADSYAKRFYDLFNPMTHLNSYAHLPAISFECAAEDYHVPPEGALRFKESLRKIYGSKTDRIRVNLYPGIGHLGPLPDEFLPNCLEWLRSH